MQAAIERALSFVADHPVQVNCAGRTDAGVHATWQVIHFDTDAERTPRSWLLGGNANLPAGVRLLAVHPVSRDFHARFSAQARSYRYVILNREVPGALLRKHRSDPQSVRYWFEDVRYALACDMFDGRKPPDYRRLAGVTTM